MRICSIDDCGQPHNARGWCNAHYHRWRRNGDPITTKTRKANSGSFKKGHVAPPGVGFQKGQTAHNKGVSPSDETRAKISAAVRRSITPEITAKVAAARARQVISPEGRRKIGDAHRGPKNVNWKGGISKLRRRMNATSWRKLREQVLERDNYTCQVCGKTNLTLVAHHIIEWPDGPDALDNLIAFCRSCHAKHHRHTPLNSSSDYEEIRSRRSA